MAALNLTSFDPILKQHYSPKRIYQLADLKNPLFALLKMKKQRPVGGSNGGGKYWYQPVDYENPGGGSADVSVAITNQTASGYEDFQVPRVKHYQIGKIDGETIEASMGDVNAFFPAMKEIDKAYKQAGRSIARKLYRTSGGYLGRIHASTTLASTKLYLADKADAFNFQVGMKLGLSGDPGTGSLRGSPTYLTVTDIDREGDSTGAYLTVSANISTVSGAALSDYIFVQGDHAACPHGLADWVPTTAPGSTTFCAVDRTTDIDRLGGLRRTASGEPLSESLIKGCSTVDKHGGTVSHVFCNPEVASDMLLEIQGKLVYDRKDYTARRSPIGFRGAEVITPTGVVNIIGDVNCPSNVMYLLQLDTWTLFSAAECPHFAKRAGLLQEGATSDDYSCRVKAYFNLACSAPGYNLVVDLS